MCCFVDWYNIFYVNKVDRRNVGRIKEIQEQRFIYETVQECQERVMASMKPGVVWEDMHTLSYRVILERFVARGILIDDIETMLLKENNVAAHFMPAPLEQANDILAHSRDAHGNTLLMIACQASKQDIINLMIQKDVDVNAQNYMGVTALHIVCYDATAKKPLLQGL